MDKNTLEIYRSTFKEIGIDLPFTPVTFKSNLSKDSKYLIDMFYKLLESDEINNMLNELGAKNIPVIKQIFNKILNQIKEENIELPETVCNKDNADIINIIEIMKYLYENIPQEKTSVKFNNMVYLPTIIGDILIHSKKINEYYITFYMSIYLLSSVFYINNNSKIRKIYKENYETTRDEIQKNMYEYTGLINKFDKDLDNNKIEIIDNIRLFPFVLFAVTFVSVCMASSNNKLVFLEILGIEITDNESQIFQNIFSNVIEIYNINKNTARIKNLNNSIALKDLENNNKDMKENKFKQIELQYLWYVFCQLYGNYNNDTGEFPQIFQKYCNSILRARIKGISYVKKEINEIRKNINEEAVKKYYKVRKNKTFQWCEYKAYYNICGIISNKQYNDVSKCVQYLNDMADMHSIAFGLESYLHNVLKKLKQYRLEHYLFDFIKLNNNLHNSLSVSL